MILLVARQISPCAKVTATPPSKQETSDRFRISAEAFVLALNLFFLGGGVAYVMRWQPDVAFV